MMRAAVFDFADRRPIWALPAWAEEELRGALEPRWEMRVARSPVDGTGDGGAEASAEAVELVAGAEAYLGYGIPSRVLRAGGSLRWVHTGTGGVAGSLGADPQADHILFTNSAGTHAPPMAESVLGMILHFARGFDVAVRAQAEGRWARAPFDSAEPPVCELSESVVGILGFGGIGRAVAERLRPLGARVLGHRRSAAGEVDGVEVSSGPEGLERLLRESDFLVITAAETDETRGILDGAALARMKPEAVLINVSRGALVDEDALVAALRAGRLRGAALDVFASEPLAPDHPLWSLPGTLLTPHVSAYTWRYWRREVELILANFERYEAGLPLLNLVDRVAGY